MMDPLDSGSKLEARKSSESYVDQVSRELDPDDFDEETRVYGYRWVEVETEDGSTRFEEVPLHWDDLFDPQEGDWLMHSPEHAKAVRDIGARLDCFYDSQGREDVAVYDDVRIDWKTSGVAPVCPDIAVIPGMRKREEGERLPKSFNEAKEGTSPCFVLEITSKETARYDRKSKPSIYRKGKVAEIFLLDEMKSPWELSGERRNPATGRYLKIRADDRGRFLAETLGIYLSISDRGDDLILEDAMTGEILRKPVEESQARRTAERQAAEEAEARRKETEARRTAERQAAEEAEAREAAEERADRAEEHAKHALCRNIEDLCTLLEIEWSAQRGAAVADMDMAGLESLRSDLLSQKRWP